MLHHFPHHRPGLWSHAKPGRASTTHKVFRRRQAVHQVLTGAGSNASVRGHSTSVAELGTWRDDEPILSFVAGSSEHQDQLLLHENVVEAINMVAIATGGPLRASPTRHAPSGKLVAQSQDGASTYVLRTYTGGAIQHMNTTVGVVPAFGLIYAKVTCHAAMDKGTPFLDVELTGIKGKGVLVCCLPSPRLSWLLHPDYLKKYWRTAVTLTPPSPFWPMEQVSSSSSSGSAAAPTETLSFEELERRVRSRMPAPSGFSAPPPPPPGTPPPPPPVYNDFHSASLYTRLASAPGFLFTFDPAKHAALEAARSDVGAVLSFWKHWVVSDSAGESLQGRDLEECRAITGAAACFLQFDPDVGRVEQQLGKETVGKMLETVSGEASLAGPPWWKDA
ncbi:hypothetical protein DUNSADRAFT_17760 [Dunaliella salina]|uniref:Uncharacterized protein n=1 Tax=Dunaliella salina TaxID=3046 RepID=A0ABQ7G164_DUNSA|nr:hypothetical protein DUNSADRAFT_17760 [Dunaliella salina]|eukprot:KAF5828349.1 hypothetical protein DUNSADRAFT_17760 [Dunaliella salina]